MTTTRPTKITSARDVRATADALGSFYFSADTMAWFRSTLLSAFWPITDDGLRGVFIVRNVDLDDQPEWRAVEYRVEAGSDGTERFVVESGEGHRSEAAARTEASLHVAQARLELWEQDAAAKIERTEPQL